jgi:hypothetical protein
MNRRNNKKNNSNTLEFDVEYPSINGEPSSSRTITVPEHVVSSSIINYCVQNYGWDRNKVKVRFYQTGEMFFEMYPDNIK